jgi:DNA modification methylase
MNINYANSLFPIDQETSEDDWTFVGAPTREMTHCYHDYPARMIPQIANKLLSLYGDNSHFLFDPYCGSGTSLVEGITHGLNVAGTDLNPLARLIAQAKTINLTPQIARKKINDFYKASLKHSLDSVQPRTSIRGITNLEFWFKPNVIIELTALLNFVNTIEDEAVKLFFQVAFSETVRECSNTRIGEFKLHRYPPEKLELFNPNVFQIMTKKLERNYKGLVVFYKKMKLLSKRPNVGIYSFNTVDGIPETEIPKESVDIVITSPPYGDSHTTVAYGQYSRLSASWLELPGSDTIDSQLMGGMSRKKIHEFPCDELNTAIKKITDESVSRAREVSGFYYDLERSINNVSTVLRKKGYACYVVGNRIVKNVQLPTDTVIRSFFEANGFTFVSMFTRSIPNKRMPKKNSPTNIIGKLVSTMTKEYIVVMRK